MTDAFTPAEIRRHALRRNVLRLAAVGILLVTVAVFTFVSVRQYFTVSEVRLPSVVGLSFEEAARVLRQARLDPVAFVENVPGTPADTVTSQAPVAGATVKRGRSVSLGVNSPSAAARAPDLVGSSRADALARAVQLNLGVERVDYRPDASPAGTVLEQTPKAGTALGDGAELQLVVSSGPQRASAELPDLAGMDVDAAVSRLHELGFREVESVPATVSFDRPGSVTGMRPAAGGKVALSTPVSLFYAVSGRNVVKVPEVAGMPLWRAQLALQASQLRIGHVAYVQDASKPGGVVKVEPSGYTIPGAALQVTVNGTPSDSPLPTFPDRGAGNLGFPGSGGTAGTSSGGAAGRAGGSAAGQAGRSTGQQAGGSAAGSRTVPFVFNPANMGVKRLMERPYELKLVVTDEQGERTVLDRKLAAGEPVSTSVVIRGDSPLLQTFIDGVFFQAWRP